jgi:hypothetical protein
MKSTEENMSIFLIYPITWYRNEIRVNELMFSSFCKAVRPL